MLGVLWAAAGVAGFAFLYFVAAIPAGVAAGVPLPVATAASCIGYACGGLAIVLLGAPLRAWLARKLRLRAEPDPRKLFWRAWERFGLAGLALLAPVTVGPQVAALIGLGLGVPAPRLVAAIAAGVVPWAAAIAVAVGSGVRLFGR